MFFWGVLLVNGAILLPLLFFDEERNTPQALPVLITNQLLDWVRPGSVSGPKCSHPPTYSCLPESCESAGRNTLLLGGALKGSSHANRGSDQGLQLVLSPSSLPATWIGAFAISYKRHVHGSAPFCTGTLTDPGGSPRSPSFRSPCPSLSEER